MTRDLSNLDLRRAPDVTFTLPGFSTVKRSQLPDSFTATVNADLRVGSLEETITVTGASPLVDTQNVAQRGAGRHTGRLLLTIRFVHTTRPCCWP